MRRAHRRVDQQLDRPVRRARRAHQILHEQPLECWFQALAVFRKADRLCQELAGDPVASVPQAPSIAQNRPGHVLAVIEAASRELAAEAILPSDVYDLASLVLGEVAFLHAITPDANPAPYPFESNQPGRKLPSHVWQLAGVLEAQLR